MNGLGRHDSTKKRSLPLRTVPGAAVRRSERSVKNSGRFQIKYRSRTSKSRLATDHPLFNNQLIGKRLQRSAKASSAGPDSNAFKNSRQFNKRINYMLVNLWQKWKQISTPLFKGRSNIEPLSILTSHSNNQTQLQPNLPMQTWTIIIQISNRVLPYYRVHQDHLTNLQTNTSSAKHLSISSCGITRN